jgi:hypothetical protein
MTVVGRPFLHRITLGRLIPTRPVSDTALHCACRDPGSCVSSTETVLGKAPQVHTFVAELTWIDGCTSFD